MKNKLFAILAILAVLSTLLFSGCSLLGGNKTPTTSAPPITANTPLTVLSDRLTAAESRLTGLENKFQLGNLVSNMQNDIVLLKADIAALQKIQSPTATYVTSAELATLSANCNTKFTDITGKLTALEGKITALETTIAAIQNKNNAQDTQIADILARLELLEHPPATTTPPPTTVITPASAITLVIASVSPNPPTIVAAGVFPQTLTYTYAFTYSNTSNQTFQNIKFNVSFLTENPAHITNATLVTMGAVTPVWISMLPPGTFYNFNNWPAVTVSAGQTVNLLLSLSVTINAAGTYYFYPQTSLVS